MTLHYRPRNRRSRRDFAETYVQQKNTKARRRRRRIRAERNARITASLSNKKLTQSNDLDEMQELDRGRPSPTSLTQKFGLLSLPETVNPTVYAVKGEGSELSPDECLDSGSHRAAHDDPQILGIPYEAVSINGCFLNYAQTQLFSPSSQAKAPLALASIKAAPPCYPEQSITLEAQQPSNFLPQPQHALSEIMCQPANLAPPNAFSVPTSDWPVPNGLPWANVIQPSANALELSSESCATGAMGSQYVNQVTSLDHGLQSVEQMQWQPNRAPYREPRQS